MLASAAGARRTSNSLERFEDDTRTATFELEVGDVTPAAAGTPAGFPRRGRRCALAVHDLQPGRGVSAPSAAVRPVLRPRRRRHASDQGPGGDRGRRAEHQRGTRPRLVSASATSPSSCRSRKTRSTRKSGPTSSTRSAPTSRFASWASCAVPSTSECAGGSAASSCRTRRVLRRVRRHDRDIRRHDPARPHEHGEADSRPVARAVRDIFGRGVAFETLGLEGRGARSAIDVLTAGLWIHSPAITRQLAATVAVGFAIARRMADAAGAEDVLGALGFPAGNGGAQRRCSPCPSRSVVRSLPWWWRSRASPLFPAAARPGRDRSRCGRRPVGDGGRFRRARGGCPGAGGAHRVVRDQASLEAPSARSSVWARTVAGFDLPPTVGVGLVRGSTVGAAGTEFPCGRPSAPRSWR